MKIAYKFVFLFFLSPTLLSANQTIEGRAIEGKVISVTDGDTLKILDKGKVVHKIRLAKIDAPEKIQSFGMKSKQNLSKICFGKQARAEVETIDRYGRSVAVISCDKVMPILNKSKEVLHGFTADTQMTLSLLKLKPLLEKKKRGYGLRRTPSSPGNLEEK